MPQRGAGGGVPGRHPQLCGDGAGEEQGEGGGFGSPGGGGGGEAHVGGAAHTIREFLFFHHIL